VEYVFSHYLQAETIEADVLTCNDQVVFSSVVIGEVLGLRPYDVNRPPTRRSTFFGAIKAVRDLRLRSYRLTTGKDQKIQLAALGMVVMEQTQSSLIGRSFSEALSIADGRLTLLALAPRSVLSYLWFLVRLLLPKKISLSRLPGAVGLVRSDRVLLEAPRGVDYSLDGTLASAICVNPCPSVVKSFCTIYPSVVFSEPEPGTSRGGLWHTLRSHRSTNTRPQIQCDPRHITSKRLCVLCREKSRRLQPQSLDLNLERASSKVSTQVCQVFSAPWTNASQASTEAFCISLYRFKASSRISRRDSS
jgi:hypothetical protein